MGYALSSAEVGCGDYVLEKADLSDFERLCPQLFSDASVPPMRPVPVIPAPVIRDSLIDAARDSVSATSALSASDSVGRGASADTATVPDAPLRVHRPDSTKFQVLIFGDSMLEWLAKRLCDYTMENGYELTSVIWYSSSTRIWAQTDTLDFFLDRIRPDFVMLCLGSNELFVRDLQKRDKYIATIVSKIGNRPFLWIGPPNWKPDTGINDLIRKNVGPERFFESRRLELDRADDEVHPTRVAAAQWMDSVATWMRSSSSYTIRMDSPAVRRNRVYRQYMLKPLR